MLFRDRLEHWDHYSQDKLSFAADNLSLGKNEQPLVWCISRLSPWWGPWSFSLTNWHRQRASYRQHFICFKICLWYKSNMFSHDSCWQSADGSSSDTREGTRLSGRLINKRHFPKVGLKRSTFGTRTMRKPRLSKKRLVSLLPEAVSMIPTVGITPFLVDFLSMSWLLPIAHCGWG